MCCRNCPAVFSVSLCNELSDGEFGCAVDADEEKELALGRLHFSDVDVKQGHEPATGPRAVPPRRWDTA